MPATRRDTADPVSDDPVLCVSRTATQITFLGRSMKFVNWYYPEARVFIRFDKGRGLEKSIRRAVGVIIGQSFFGWMLSEEVPRETRPETTAGPGPRSTQQNLQPKSEASPQEGT